MSWTEVTTPDGPKHVFQAEPQGGRSGGGGAGIVGVCWGGRVTFLAAARRSLGAGVGFYGGGS